MLSEILLWLFVIFSGLAIGAGLYEMRIVVPRWFSRRSGFGIQINSEAMRADDSGRRFWAFVTTGPLTLLTIASCIAAWNPQTSWEWWWLLAAGVTLVERMMTLGFFIPNGLKLMQVENLPSGRAEALAGRWVRLNYVRAFLALSGWLLALKALSLFASAPLPDAQTNVTPTVVSATMSPTEIGPGFVSQTLQRDGTNLHFVRGGSGPLVVLIHGYPQDWWEWRRIMPKLADRFTIVAVDLRGVGFSRPAADGYDAATLAEDVHAVVESLHTGSAYIVGHDIGGMVAYAYARLYSENTRGAMIMDVGLPGLEPWSEAERLPFL